MRKIAFISMHPAPYRNSFIRELVKCNEFDVDVFNLFDVDKGHDFWHLDAPGFSAQSLQVNHMSFVGATMRLLWRFVLSGEYDFVMWPGWTYKCLLLPIFVSALSGRKFGFVADTVEQRKISKFALSIKRYIVGKAKIVHVPGKASKSFFVREFKKNPEQIVTGAYSLDGRSLEEIILARRADKRCIIRRELGVADDVNMFLMVANMTPNRCYPVTAHAFLNVAKRDCGNVFVAVGRGRDFDAMRRISEDEPSVKVIEGCSFDDMLSLYAAADVYVHGGKEPASTALIIGAIAHLPIIASKAVGCAADVLEDNVSGCVVENYQSAASWTNAFEKMINNKSKWSELGDAARERSKALDVSTAVKSFVEPLSKI